MPPMTPLWSMLRHNRNQQLLTLSLCLSVGLLPVWCQQAAWADSNKGSDAPLAMMELEPELDLGQPDEPSAQSNVQPAEKPAVTDDKPLKAKAVVVDVNSKTLNYDQDRDVYIATGNVHVVISEQNSELFADHVIYDQNQNLLIAEGHVNIYKKGEKTTGSYAKIDLTRESALINDVITRVEQVRVKAAQSMIGQGQMMFENGRVIIKPEMFTSMIGGKPQKTEVAQTDPKTLSPKALPKDPANVSPPKGKVTKTYDPTTETRLSRLAYTDPFASSLDSVDRTEEVVDLQSTDETDWDKTDFLHVKAKEINIYRWKDGYTKVDVKKPSLYAGKFKLGTLSNTQFSSDINTNEMEYLGPDIGFDPDYGGFYYGPGYDFRLGNGSVRFSPLATFGGGYRRDRGGRRLESTGIGPGVGAALHYRGDDSRIDLAITSKVGQPILYAEKMLFDKKTRLIATANEDYVNGFMGFERPKYGTMLADNRTIGEWGKFRLDTFESIGVFKDEFYPNNQREYFVEAKPDASPLTAGRIQLQAQIANTSPLLRVGNFMDFGFRLQAAAAGYTTGDMVGVLRGGPSVTLRYKDRARTSLRYFLATTVGETPFIFDTYYQGRQQVGWSNSFKINDYLTVGSNTQFSVNRDNARNALVTTNQLYVLTGPKHVKFNLAYDVVNQRSYFGLTFLPGKDGKPIDYDTMRVFSPDQYMTPGAAPVSAIAP